MRTYTLEQPFIKPAFWAVYWGIADATRSIVDPDVYWALDVLEDAVDEALGQSMAWDVRMRMDSDKAHPNLEEFLAGLLERGIQ